MYTCRACNQSFQSELALELHRDQCAAGQLLCQQCGGRFREAEATDDGWAFECPDANCSGAGLGEDLIDVRDVRSQAH